jgi:hypothetical protein
MCKVVASAIAADGQAVANALNQIAHAPNVDPAIASKLEAAATAIIAATSNWQTGSLVTDINDAANVAEAVLAEIPLTAPYATFVAIAVTALDILIANLNTQATQTANVVGNAVAVAAHIDTLPDNPYRGIVPIRAGIRGYRHAVINRWNQQVEDEPILKFAKI